VRADLIAGEDFVSYYAVPLMAKGQIKGVLEIFHRSLLQPNQEWLDFLETLGGQTAIAVDNPELFENLQRSNLDLTFAYDKTIEGWSRAMICGIMKPKGIPCVLLISRCVWRVR
jgi:signal transduction protein with GAF and PtsI domain